MSDEIPSTASVSLISTLPLDTFDLVMNIPGTNKPVGWVITLAGPAHPQTVALSNDAERDRLKKAADIERAQINGRKYKGDEDMSPAESRRKYVSGVVGRIIGWKPAVDFGSGPVEFTPAAAIDLFCDPKMGGYYTQVVEYLTADRAFMPASPTN